MTNDARNKAIHAAEGVAKAQRENPGRPMLEYRKVAGMREMVSKEKSKLNSQMRNGQNDADFARSKSIMKGTPKKQGTSDGYMHKGQVFSRIPKTDKASEKSVRRKMESRIDKNEG